MKYLALAGALALAASLGACADGVSTFTSDINSITSSLSSPAAGQAVANLKAGAAAIICDVSSAAALDQQINKAIDAGTALDKDANEVYTVSSLVCTSLGGTVAGNAIIPAAAAAAQ